MNRYRNVSKPGYDLGKEFSVEKNLLDVDGPGAFFAGTIGPLADQFAPSQHGLLEQYPDKLLGLPVPVMERRRPRGSYKVRKADRKAVLADLPDGRILADAADRLHDGLRDGGTAGVVLFFQRPQRFDFLYNSHIEQGKGRNKNPNEGRLTPSFSLGVVMPHEHCPTGSPEPHSHRSMPQ